MGHSFLVERDGVSGKITRIFEFETSGVVQRDHDHHGAVKKRFMYDKERNAILEHSGEKDQRVKRVLTFQDEIATLSEGGKFGKITRTYQVDPEGTRIKEREGGKFGPIKRTFVFDPRGVLEKEGEEYRDSRLFIFDKEGASVTERDGGWFGKTKRILFGEGLSTDSFKDPQGFLQLLFYID